MSDKDVSATGVWIGFAFAPIAFILTEAVNRSLSLGLGPQVTILVLPTTMWWSLAINLYLLYHRVTLPLPLWLTSGHSVAYGGMISNVCDEPNAYLDYKGDGSWPCLPSMFSAWLTDLTGPKGWNHLFHPPDKVIACLVFATGNLLVLAVFVHGLRTSRFRRARQRGKEARRSKACEEGVETGLFNLSKSEGE